VNAKRRYAFRRSGRARRWPPSTAVAALVFLAGILTGPGAMGVAGQEIPDDAPGAQSSKPRIQVTLVSEGPSLTGDLSDPLWAQATPARGFVQRQPREGAPAETTTEVWLLVDPEALYIGARMLESRRGPIPTSLTRRDDPAEGSVDYFEVALDPNLDQRTGYRFRVTSANAQLDAYLFDDASEDLDWNAVWESRVQVAEGYWTVEMRIPFSQLRYESRGHPHLWGVNFTRFRALAGEESQFALVSRLRTGRVSQFGYLTDMVVPSRVGRTEFRPFVLTSTAAKNGGPNGGSTGGSSPFEGTRQTRHSVGLDTRLPLGSAFTLDVTLNPDFSQVDADPAVVNLTGFETFYRERRPFFVEDARIFDFDLGGRGNQLFYSRRVGREPQLAAPSSAKFSEVPASTPITGAAKVTGRTTRGLSLGVLGGRTGEAVGRHTVAGSEEVERFLAEPAARFLVMRARQELRDGETLVGVMGTGFERSLPTAEAKAHLPKRAWAGGLDWFHTWDQRSWAFSGILAATRVAGDAAAMVRVQEHPTHLRQRPDLEWGKMDSTATAISGLQWTVRVSRIAGATTGSVYASQLSSGFEANDLGFTTSRERLEAGFDIGRQWVEPGAWVLSRRMGLRGSTSWSNALRRDFGSPEAWRANRYRSELAADWELTFLSLWRLRGDVSFVPTAVSRGATRGGPRTRDPAVLSGGVSGESDPRRPLQLRPGIQGQVGREGVGWRAEAFLEVLVRPTPGAQLSIAPRWDRRRLGDQFAGSSAAVPYPETYGRRYFFAEMDRQDLSIESRLVWVFTPRLSFQMLAQPLISTGNVIRYRQLAAPETFRFLPFVEGVFEATADGPRCRGGSICQGPGGLIWVDLDGDGQTDDQIRNRSFHLRAIRTTAVLRWEHPSGSSLLLAWQRKQEGAGPGWGESTSLDDLRALLGLPSEDQFVARIDLRLTR
jgi:hypothetical protein